MESENHPTTGLGPQAELAAATRALRMEVQRRKRWGGKRTAALEEPAASATTAETEATAPPAESPAVLTPKAPPEPAPQASAPRPAQPGASAAAPSPTRDSQNTPKRPQNSPGSQPSSSVGPVAGNLEILRDQIRVCASCSLGASPERSGAILGTGAARPKLLYITDHIGPAEAARGKSLDEKAGQLLMKITTAGMGLKVEEVHTTSAVKCGLPPGCVPSPKESAACGQWLAREIRLLRPEAIVTLGAGAAKALFDGGPKSGGFLGKLLHYKGIPTVAIHHPRAMLGRKDLKGDAWESLKLLIGAMNR